MGAWRGLGSGLDRMSEAVSSATDAIISVNLRGIWPSSIGDLDQLVTCAFDTEELQNSSFVIGDLLSSSEFPWKASGLVLSLIFTEILRVLLQRYIWSSVYLSGSVQERP